MYSFKIDVDGSKLDRQLTYLPSVPAVEYYRGIESQTRGYPIVSGRLPELMWSFAYGARTSLPSRISAASSTHSRPKQ